MSDTGIFRSSQPAALANAESILASATAVETKLNITIFRTRLSVVNNITDLEEQLSLCNTEFKQLVADDADSILKLAEFFVDFDTEMSDDMNIGISAEASREE